MARTLLALLAPSPVIALNHAAVPLADGLWRALALCHNRVERRYLERRLGELDAG